MFKCESSKCRCITEVPCSAMRRLHWPWNKVYWWIVSVWAGSMSACHWNHMLLLMIKTLCDVDAKSCWRWRCRDDVGRSVMPLPSHAGDGAAEWCWRWRCRDDVGCGVMPPSSHADDGAAEATWSRRDVDIESCWWWYCRVMLATARLRRLGRGAM
jgi:hypothetical protein